MIREEKKSPFSSFTLNLTLRLPPSCFFVRRGKRARMLLINMRIKNIFPPTACLSRTLQGNRKFLQLKNRSSGQQTGIRNRLLALPLPQPLPTYDREQSLVAIATDVCAKIRVRDSHFARRVPFPLHPGLEISTRTGLPYPSHTLHLATPSCIEN
ncbi:hypothetical protein CEXT_183461 [Caerostris extrusa]|uniref:Uncharacterized protein n=1 Tax=Caerostris extrusa TaxID=172846 RepID=A0AAV4MPU4_CAEEX|nr:hypothetical protein CEXT_183461 [Caerostris extrusa]